MPNQVSSAPKITYEKMRKCELASQDIIILMSGWSRFSSENRSHFHKCRLSSIFSFIGFGSLVCTMLIHKNNILMGFSFLLITMTFSIILDHFYKRKERAWGNTQETIDERSFLVSVFGFVDYIKNYEEFETPQKIFGRYYSGKYQIFPTDILSSLIMAIALCIAILTGVIAAKEHLEINWKTDVPTEKIEQELSQP